ncbi:protein ELF4-LIKE 3-like isoform X1 [Vicia villosa]|uniref:protein ELF4-LIKE 3-like isoform X1 n=2 Tax=Vicia villosa TaxID=3911 RepID=UPI00273C166E|nr:protein ELF4-LIKE 3-like isoform X1 [Vicia villosa]
MIHAHNLISLKKKLMLVMILSLRACLIYFQCLKDWKRKMEGDTYSSHVNGTQTEGKILQTFQKSFVQVQNILDQNRVLINEINQNHESRVPDNLSRNVGLIKELNNNIRRVVDLYADLSSSFTKSIDVSSEGDSSGAAKSEGNLSHKRHRPL